MYHQGGKLFCVKHSRTFSRACGSVDLVEHLRKCQDNFDFVVDLSLQIVARVFVDAVCYGYFVRIFLGDITRASVFSLVHSASFQFRKNVEVELDEDFFFFHSV